MRVASPPDQARGIEHAAKGHDLIDLRVAVQGGRELRLNKDRDVGIGPAGF